MSRIGPPPGLKKNSGSGCQCSMPWRHQEGRCPTRMRPILPSSTSLRARLSAAAEEGVRRAAELQAAGFASSTQLAALLEVDGEGLFGVDVLAGAQRRERYAEYAPPGR